MPANQAAGVGQAIVCSAGAEQGQHQAPEWIPLLPDARLVEARDGRKWLNDSPQALIDAFKANGADLYVDWDHEGALNMFGGRSPAAGWIKELRIAGTYGIEGRVEWTTSGRASVEGQDYRYISPWINTERIEADDEQARSDDSADGRYPRIVRIVNAALVNMPALRMSALTHEHVGHHSPAKPAGETMNKAILKALGLAETATESDAILQITEIRSKQVDLAHYVPRADFDTLNATLEKTKSDLATANEQLAERDAAKLESEITAALDAAQASGKMAPASREMWADYCRAGNLDKFKSHMAAAAPVVAPKRSTPSLPASGSDIAADAQLTNEDRHVARLLRVPTDKVAATRRREVAAREGEL